MPNKSSDIIDILTEQHSQLDELFEKLEDATAPNSTFTKLANMLVAHAAAEEKVFYPAVMAKETTDMLYESVEEHLAAKRVLADLVAGGLKPENFKAKMSVLKEDISHHAHEEEEKELFPKVRSLFEKSFREELGQKYQQAFDDAMQAHNAVPVDTATAAPLPALSK
ncbi:MAG: hemerythrin domain-containing protein [Kofleriaceae bacterium]